MKRLNYWVSAACGFVQLGAVLKAKESERLTNDALKILKEAAESLLSVLSSKICFLEILGRLLP